jgi:hypothetical protein
MTSCVLILIRIKTLLPIKNQGCSTQAQVEARLNLQSKGGSKDPFLSARAVGLRPTREAIDARVTLRTTGQEAREVIIKKK